MVENARREEEAALRRRGKRRKDILEMSGYQRGCSEYCDAKEDAQLCVMDFCLQRDARLKKLRDAEHDKIACISACLGSRLNHLTTSMHNHLL